MKPLFHQPTFTLGEIRASLKSLVSNVVEPVKEPFCTFGRGNLLDCAPEKLAENSLSREHTSERKQMTQQEIAGGAL